MTKLFLVSDGCTVYITIPDDDSLFDGKGDYQFDIYREMKKENKYVMIMKKSI